MKRAAAVLLLLAACRARPSVQQLSAEKRAALTDPFDAAKDRPRIIVGLSPT